MSFYRSSEGGYSPAWGPPSSTLKYTATALFRFSKIANFDADSFCEELHFFVAGFSFPLGMEFAADWTRRTQDYEFTPYIAELFNTLTNLIYIGLGIKGLINTCKLAEGLAPKLPYLALINLGLASSLFHSSLKYSTQMCDEFSMLIATFIVFYQLLLFSQTMVAPRTLLVALCALMLVVLVAQILTGESTVQQIVFTGIVYWLWHMCFKLIGNFDGEEAARRKMRWMAISGIAFFVTGHACWVTDFYACNGLREIRRNIGMPWAAVFELHGFWHLFTGIGVYIFMVLAECLRLAPRGSKMTSKGLQLSSAGTWPFMVYLEDAGTQTNKKNN